MSQSKARPARHVRRRRHHAGARQGISVLVVIREFVMIFVVAVLISALIKTFLIQSFIIPSESMTHTLEVDDRILVSKLVPSVRSLNRGDIVVFEDKQHWLQQNDLVKPTTSPVLRFLTLVGLRPDDSQGYLVKRVIGLPGDTVACCDASQRVTVNGTPIDEPYLHPGAVPSEVDFSVTVPAGSLWVMGDNRQNSLDSRAHRDQPGRGFVPIDDVVGRAFVIMWPVGRWAPLSNTNAFLSVPTPPAPHE